MKIVDLNVLLYAVNADARQHRPVLSWWTGALRGDESVGLPWAVLLGFLRLATNPRVFPVPLTTDQACARIATWLRHPLVHVPVEKEEHWAVLRRLVADTGTAGNLTADAHLAALALTRDAVLVSCDNDFARFRGLRYLNPLTSA